jgi:hypothetical protein
MGHTLILHVLRAAALAGLLVGGGAALLAFLAGVRSEFASERRDLCGIVAGAALTGAGAVLTVMIRERRPS